MQDIIQALIHKAPVLGLRLKLKNSGLCLGDPVQVELTEGGDAMIFANALKRGFLFRRLRRVPVGHLGPQASALIRPALDHGDTLRVRIVGMTPEHLAPDGKAELHVSVWGDARHISALGLAPIPPAQAPLAPDW